jgi:hypothetical protein
MQYDSPKHGVLPVYTAYIPEDSFLYFWFGARCSGNLFTEQMPSDSPGIVDVCTDRCLETGVYAPTT